AQWSNAPVVVGAKEIDLPPAEVAFLEQVCEIVEDQMADPDFGVDQLAESLAMGRRQLLRKLRALVDETPGDLIRRIRLERAAQLLEAGGTSVKEVADLTGFASGPYFSRAFKQRYGVAPSRYEG
ncbi:MAG: helix-turn-helix transcriptional regulator, partial [Rhodothermales bacterium]|nr:helix-turn-helix transcriptional regulator [Rhodothermales bacterium]